jgi:hypothetical protein
VFFRIVKGSHGFKVFYSSVKDLSILEDFNNSLTLKEEVYNYRLRKTELIIKQRFYTTNEPLMYIGYVNGCLTPLLDYLNLRNVGKDLYSLEKVYSRTDVAENNLILRDGQAPREKQLLPINFVMQGSSIAILPLQTGFGKTFIGLWCAKQLNVRTVVILGAMHIETWIKDANTFFSNAKEEIIVIKGRSDLNTLIKLSKTSVLSFSILLISVNTLRDYINNFLIGEPKHYECIPEELFQVLDIGFKIVDECHQNINFCYKHNIETNVSKALFLSATLSSHNNFMNKIYELIFPSSYRLTGIVWEKFIKVVALAYQVSDLTSVKYMGPKGYSHHTYEATLMKKKSMLYNYFELICLVIIKGFHEKYQPTQKMLIFISGVQFGERLVNHINSHALLKKYSCELYYDKAPDEVLHNRDIVVSTVLKAGTGKDIKGLVTVLATIMIDSKEQNIQMIGRLRPIENMFPGVVPTYYYLVATNIIKHVQYHRRKNEYFYTITKEYISLQTHRVI